MRTLPRDVFNRSIDRLPGLHPIQSPREGSREANWLLRNYGQIVRQLLRAAHWSFARKIATLELLGDVTGQTLDPGTGKTISTTVEIPWTYVYAWPSDGVNARWMPWAPVAPAAASPPAALTTVVGAQALNGPPFQIPARFLVGMSENFPAGVGQIDFDNMPELDGIEGVGLIGRKVVWTDVPQAQFCYTKLVLEIELWDDLFEEAMVATLAEKASSMMPDAKVGLSMKAQQIAIAKDAISQARVMDANDQGYPQTTNHQPSWITGRSRGGWWGGSGGITGWASDGPGILYSPWSPMAFSDGSVF